MEVPSRGTEYGTSVRYQDRRGRFEEEEWLFWPDISELIDVVSSDVWDQLVNGQHDTNDSGGNAYT